ncbi:MAG: glycosyltransferase family 2 protein, partial [Desulfovermiculus sp.]|nr:glycosyltransferase family 2 protein [Desulfovermiculus sp.]
KLTGSIVLYNNQFHELEKAINSFTSSSLLKKLYLIDNSASRPQITATSEITTYIYNYSNLGFGSGHNIALTLSRSDNAPYHLVMNPDVYFQSSALESLVQFMDDHPDVGLVMPKILYPDGTLQHLCKLLPTPQDLIGRRFFPFLPWFKKRNMVYELRFADYNTCMSAPFLSGSFMLLRRQALQDVGNFDERFFLYMEDADLCRRIRAKFKTAYYPQAQIYHTYSKASYQKFHLLYQHIKSAILYFNKWGWFRDKERDRVNAQTLRSLGYNKHKIAFD